MLTVVVDLLLLNDSLKALRREKTMNTMVRRRIG